MRFGAHIGVGGGWARAAEYADEVGCECVQVFSKSPRMWRATRLDLDGVAEFRRVLAERDIGPVFVHTSYLINLGSKDPTLWERSIDALSEEFRRAGAIGAGGLVSHVGTDPFGDADRAAARIADAVARARASTDDAGRGVRLLLENTAGAGRQFGGAAEELGPLLCSIEDRGAGPTGVCLDTCHAHAFGYALHSAGAWGSVLDELEEACRGAALGLVHANDCRYPRGERKDRHEWIGDGVLGMAAFEAMVACERLQDIPVVVEMPGDPPEKDLRNIERLKALRADRCA